MSDYFGFPNMANVPNPSEWKHADTAKDWAEKANNSAVLAKNYAQQIVDSVDVIDEHVHQMDEHITDVTAEVLTAAQTATTKAAQAATSEANASASATSASTSATSAATSATSAADSATSANTYKNTAQSAATDAVTAKTAAQTAATTATTKAAEAASSATDAATAKSYAQQIATSVESSVEEAETYATNAQTYANAAGTHADEAETSAQLADTKATAATASANAAAASVTQAQQVVSTASAYAAQAQTQATNAATSASAAATSATNAASSADAASISAESASTDAEAASTFADSADSSADAAAASATTAEGHKDNAAASALTAQNFKVQASTFATNAQNSATAAAQSAADAASSASSVNMNEFTEDHTPRYIAETKTLQEGYFILPGAQDGMTSNVVAYDSTQFVRLFKDATAIKQIINAHTFLNEMKITRTAQNTLVCSDPYDNTVNTNWQYNSTKSPENSAYNTTDTYRTVTYTMPTATTSTRTYRLGTTNTARTKTCYCTGELPISGMAADTIYYTVDAAGTTITGRYNTNWTGNESDLQFDYYAKVYYDTLGSAAKLANFKATETINFTGGFEYSYNNGCKFYWTSYSNSGIGRNRKLIDTIGVTEEAAVPDSIDSSVDNFSDVSGIYLGTNDTGFNSIAINGSYLNYSSSKSGDILSTTFLFYNNCTVSTTNYKTTNIKDIAFKYKDSDSYNDTSLSSVEVYTDATSADYTTLTSGVHYIMQRASDNKYVLHIKADITVQKIVVKFTTSSYYTSLLVGKIVPKTTYGSKSSVKLGNANSVLDMYSARIKHDHRVRVHINLPFKDHMNDNDGFDHYHGSFGFSGGNFCPDSDVQYCGVDRYKDKSYWHKFGDVGVSGLIHNGSDYPNTINTSPGKTSFTETSKMPTYGRLHTGWCSWALHPLLGAKSTLYNYSNGYTAVSRPYSKLYVPAALDITEDSTHYISTLDRAVKSGYNLANTRGNTYNFNNPYHDNHTEQLEANVMKYVIPANYIHTVGSTATNVYNPRSVVYAGLSLALQTRELSSFTKGYYSLTDSTYGLARNNIDYLRQYFTNLRSDMDRLSIIGPNNWHENPILPDNCNTNFNSPRNFLDRFFTTSSSGRSFGTNIFKQGETLGIRYFDATAQEWRVFSPGDNCSYGYDGTHWNYREYLWVDLDKPVTYIVGGITDGVFNGANFWQINWSNYGSLGAYADSVRTGTCSPYMVESYCPASNCGVQYNKPSDDWDQYGVTKTNDLIHVETPNFDNYTSYSTWRGLTLMTVDYSSSPLNADNTVYCADSAYGAEDSGTLDLTKVSCMYSVDPMASTKVMLNNTDNNVVKSSIVTDGTNCYTNSNSSSAYYNPVSEYNNFITKSNSNVFNSTGSNTHMEHTCYHIRIGIES